MLRSISYSAIHQRNTPKIWLLIDMNKDIRVLFQRWCNEFDFCKSHHVRKVAYLRVRVFVCFNFLVVVIFYLVCDFQLFGLLFQFKLF